MRLIQKSCIFIFFQILMTTTLMADVISIQEYLFEKEIEGTIPVFQIQYTLNFDDIESNGAFITTSGRNVTIKKYNKETKNGNILGISMTPEFIESIERGDFLSLTAKIDIINGSSQEKKVNLFDGKVSFSLDEEPTITKLYDQKNMSLHLKAKKMFMYKNMVEKLNKRNSCS